MECNTSILQLMKVLRNFRHRRWTRTFMYEEFDDGEEAFAGIRSQADPSLIDSVRLSFLGLMSKLTPSVYEPLLADSPPGGDHCDKTGAQAAVDSKSDMFSTDSSTGGSVVATSGVRHKSFYLSSSSMCACFLNLISSIIGSGVLGLPYAFSKTGWSLGLCLMVSCSLCSVFGLHLLTSCAARSQPFSIQSVLKDSPGFYSVLVELSQLLSCFGACLSYLVVIGGLMSSLVSGFGASHTIWAHRDAWIIVGFVIVVPPCFIETLDTLKYTSALSLIFICFVGFILLIFSLGLDEFDPCPSSSDDENCRGDMHSVSASWDTLRVLSIFVFAFSGTQNIFSVMNELSNPNPQRTSTLISSANGVVLFVYAMVAICGYLTYGTEVESNVLRSSPNTVGFGLARVFSSLCVAFAFPVQFFPARNALLALIDMIPACKFKDGVADSTELKLRLMVVASFLLLLTFTVALLVSDLGGILSFFGTCSIIMGYIFPGASYYMMYRESDTSAPWMKYGALILLGVGFVFFPISFFSVIYRYNWTK